MENYDLNSLPVPTEDGMTPYEIAGRIRMQEGKFGTSINSPKKEIPEDEIDCITKKYYGQRIPELSSLF